MNRKLPLDIAIIISSITGAILVCTHGNKYTLLDICKDHGVYYQNQPILTCNDYIPEENIFSFGACGNIRFEPVYSNEAPHPRDTVADLNGDERYKCFPVLLDGWGCGVAKERQKGCCISNKSDINYDKKIRETSIESLPKYVLSRRIY